MGIDVNLYIEGEISDEQISQINAYLTNRRVAPQDDWDQEHGYERLSRSSYIDDRVEFSTTTRYYGPGYERGPWPQIYAIIRCLLHAAPAGCRVFYGGDSSDDGMIVDEQILQEIWDHFLGPAGNAYRQSIWSAGTAEETR